MSTMSSTSRRPSTAHTTPLSRMPYEAGEALLWERQNARAYTHLSLQMKDLQSTHDAYGARIAATEAIAETAEAAVHKVKMLEKIVEAIEADEREGPFVGWVKEAIGQLQVSVDAVKGVRSKVSAIEIKVDRLGEDVDGMRDEGGVLRGVLRRLEVLEGERRDEGRKARELERLVERLKTEGHRRGNGYEEVTEEAHDEVQADGNPLAVFYGIETQSPTRRRESPSTREASPIRRQEHGRDSRDAFHGDSSSRRLAESSQRRHGDLQPPDEDIVRPEDNSFDLLEAAPDIEHGWENTQQFKNMQKELAVLRAMCRTQEPKNSNDTADATQRPHETIVVRRENNVDFSDATTETEAEYNDNRNHSDLGAARGAVGALSSDIQLPSSPPKRTETQSARRNLMKRPSIYDPRVPSENANKEPKGAAPDPRAETGQDVQPSLLVRLPVETCPTNKASAKRKRVDIAPEQRVTRPRSDDDRTTSRKPVAPAATKNQENVFAEHMPFAFSDDAPAPLSLARNADVKQKPAVDRPNQRAAPQAGPNRPEQPSVPVAKRTVSVTEAVDSRKAIGKPKSKPKPVPAQQQPPPEAVPSSSKQAPVTLKKEAKGPRQPAGACKSCRSRHQKCDRTHPTCGRCAKLSASCEYPQASTATMQNAAPSSSPRKKQALLPIKKSTDEADREEDLRGRSVTVSPEAPRQKSPAKRPVPASLSKKPTIAAPTAASSRTPRAKNTQTSRASPQK